MNCIQWCMVVCLVLSSSISQSERINDERRGFSVADSIGMITFSDPYTRYPSADCKLSPDGKHFMVVTTKGVLRSNQLESSLWIYRKAAVEKYLEGKAVHAPSPHLLLRITGVPIALENNSYGSLITSVEWSSDSHSILSLVENRNGYRHLVRTSLSGKDSVDITPGDGIDVQSFSEANGTIAYLNRAHAEARRRQANEPITKDASAVLTGSTLFHIMFPKQFPYPSSFANPLVLWVHYKGRNWKLNKGVEAYFPAAAASVLRIALSPNGRSLIAAQPVSAIPASWSRYQSASSAIQFHPPTDSADRSGMSFDWPWQYNYIDLDTGSSRTLVAAPSDYTTGFEDVFEASWSKSGKEALFTSSYLPLAGDGSTRTTESLEPCAAGIYNVSNGTVSCVAYARFPERSEDLRSASFGESDNEIVLRWWNDGAEITEVYVRMGTSWMLKNDGHRDGATTGVIMSLRRDIILSLRQDIREPPSLWASDKSANTSKLLWNPNPQLASIELGKAQVYHWQDKSGYTWRGGLVLPPKFVPGRRYPLVLQTHGFYNEHEFLVDGSFTSGFAAQPLAAAGMIVLQMEDRSDRHIRPAQEEAEMEVMGFESAIDQLNKDGLIDPMHVGIIGFSRTHWYVESALIHAPHRYSAATLIDGVDQSYVTDILFAPTSTLTAREHESANGGKPFGEGLERWMKSAVGFNLDKVKAPVRIEAIGLVSVLGEWELYSSLFQQRKPVDLILISNGQHILQAPRNRYVSQQGNVDWFRFWLQGYERTNPEDPGQYKRWEHLRQLRDADAQASERTSTSGVEPH